MSHRLCRWSRRHLLQRIGGGAGWLALHAMRAAAATSRPAITAARPVRARRVLWLFMHGGPSHVDLFDPKPDLQRLNGQPLPASFGNVMTRRKVAANPLLGPVKRFRPRGQSGLPISDFLPRLAQCADELLVIRSMHGDSVNHPQSVYQMNTGRILMGSPSVGSWVAYGLGTENQNMPAFIVLPDPGGGLKGGPPAWGSGYLPASYQGVTLRPGQAPILNLAPASLANGPSSDVWRLTRRLNEQHLADRGGDALEARIAAYELAFRMQTEAPRLVDFAQESQATLDLYGVGRKPTDEFGRRCLLARRLLESGVRFVQVHSGDTNGWDAHSNVAKNHGEYCARTDQPVAALLKDLKQRGLLDETLVIWGGEFGRMPMSEQGAGRDHNPWGYSVWIAGAGVQGGRAFGGTDEVGLRAVEHPVHVRDFHATILHLLGIDHEELSYLHDGLEQRLTGPQEAHVPAGLL